MPGAWPLKLPWLSLVWSASRAHYKVCFDPSPDLTRKQVLSPNPRRWCLAGLDAVMFMRIMLFGIQLFLPMSIFGMAIRE